MQALAGVVGRCCSHRLGTHGQKNLAIEKQLEELQGLHWDRGLGQTAEKGARAKKGADYGSSC